MLSSILVSIHDRFGVVLVPCPYGYSPCKSKRAPYANYYGGLSLRLAFLHDMNYSTYFAALTLRATALLVYG